MPRLRVNKRCRTLKGKSGIYWQITLILLMQIGLVKKDLSLLSRSRDIDRDVSLT